MAWLDDLKEKRKSDATHIKKRGEEAKEIHQKFDPMVRRLLREAGHFLWGRSLFLFPNYHLSHPPRDFSLSQGEISWHVSHDKSLDSIEVQFLYGGRWTRPVPRFVVVYTYSGCHYSADTTDDSEGELKTALRNALKR